MTEIAEARPSSTVVLVRDTDDAPEVYLVKRHASSAFGNAHVFPGGIVDRSDADVHRYCRGIDPDEANRRLAVASALDYFVAAIRELFEETGVLLAEHGLDDAQLTESRRRLNDASLDWRHFVADHELALRCDALHYFSHWITPDALPKRFTTRFFVARLPHGQRADFDRLELTDGVWMTAAAALAAGERGDIELHFPTMRTLIEIAGHDRVDALIAWADRRADAGVEAIHPVLPPGFPDVDPRLPGKSGSSP